MRGVQARAMTKHKRPTMPLHRPALAPSRFRSTSPDHCGRTLRHWCVRAMVVLQVARVLMRLRCWAWRLDSGSRRRFLSPTPAVHGARLDPEQAATFRSTSSNGEGLAPPNDGRSARRALSCSAVLRVSLAVSVPYVALSWTILERSRSRAACRWLLLKTLIPAFAVLLGLAGHRAANPRLLVLRARPRPVPAPVIEAQMGLPELLVHPPGRRRLRAR